MTRSILLPATPVGVTDQPATRRPRVAAGARLAAVALLVAACNPFSNPPAPTASPTISLPTAAATATRTPAPTPTPQLVKSITLVAKLAEPKAATPSGLTWQGIQDVGGKIGAPTKLVEPASNAELASDVAAAAAGDRAVVVTVGPDSHAAVLVAAVASPATQFFEMDVAVPAGSPANVHGIVFDDSQVGYLAGFVAGAFAGDGKVGFVGNVSGDVRSANYAAGFGNGAAQARSGVGVAIGDSGTGNLPDKGRTSAAGLVKSGATVISAQPDLAGIGAMREACSRKVQFVAVAVDAWQIVPDARPCLIASVLNRYDVAVANAIGDLGAGPAATTIEDVSTGGIAVGDFHADRPAGFDAKLAGVLAALKAGPPHPTPAPPSVPPAAASQSVAP